MSGEVDDETVQRGQDRATLSVDNICSWALHRRARDRGAQREARTQSVIVVVSLDRWTASIKNGGRGASFLETGKEAKNSSPACMTSGSALGSGKPVASRATTTASSHAIFVFLCPLAPQRRRRGRGIRNGARVCGDKVSLPSLTPARPKGYLEVLGSRNIPYGLRSLCGRFWPEKRPTLRSLCGRTGSQKTVISDPVIRRMGSISLLPEVLQGIGPGIEIADINRQGYSQTGPDPITSAHFKYELCITLQASSFKRHPLPESLPDGPQIRAFEPREKLKKSSKLGGRHSTFVGKFRLARLVSSLSPTFPRSFSASATLAPDVNERVCAGSSETACGLARLVGEQSALLVYVFCLRPSTYVRRVVSRTSAQEFRRLFKVSDILSSDFNCAG
ncbi:hypothetical protein C8R47DRAFT_1070014 [Mycena vitilis]|nr:hypothetical protein C8R47DRAFT_1070014 [Mycena vitilis]